MSGNCQLLFLQTAFLQKHAQVRLCHQNFSCRLIVYIAHTTEVPGADFERQWLCETSDITDNDHTLLD